MAVYKRGERYWVEFTIAGKRVREPAKTTRKTIAKEYERNRKLELERAYAGISAEDPALRLRSVSEALKPYLETYPLNHRPKSVAFATERLAHVKRLLGGVLLPDLTEDRIKRYIAARKKEGVSGRTINMELGELSRAIGKKWRELWPGVRKLEERKDIGRALPTDEEQQLLEAADASQSQIIAAFVRIALLTALRLGEIRAPTVEHDRPSGPGPVRGSREDPERYGAADSDLRRSLRSADATRPMVHRSLR